MQSKKQAEGIVGDLRRHPRCVYQELLSTDAHLERLVATLPQLVPFKGERYAGFVPILDWDHHLPTRNIMLRVYGFYSEESLTAGQSNYSTRCRQIEARDRFPEFDVPDFSELPSDEAYEVVVEAGGDVVQVQLSSEWRRNIEAEKATVARRVVRRAEEYKRLSQSGDRPDFLGDLEARSWTPPCEGGFPHWTIDVWYLLEYNGMMGKGLSFLVHPETEKVVNVREFVLRSQ